MVVAALKQSVFWTTRDNLWQLTIGRNQMWTLGKLHSVKKFRGIVHIVIWHVLHILISMRQICWEFQMFSSYVDFLNTETWKYGKVAQSISGENGTRGKDVGSGIGGPLLHIPECFRVFGNLLLSISPNTLGFYQKLDLTSRQEYVSLIGNATSISSMPLLEAVAVVCQLLCFSVGSWKPV